ncbi:MAG: hypothetical protein MK135_13390, partial [Polyangiaceae bacterium]|nr:hypothetical protein [Polyangiaceae bacterium]
AAKVQALLSALDRQAGDDVKIKARWDGFNVKLRLGHQASSFLVRPTMSEGQCRAYLAAHLEKLKERNDD